MNGPKSVAALNGPKSLRTIIMKFAGTEAVVFDCPIYTLYPRPPPPVKRNLPEILNEFSSCAITLL
jgi:hypothetical protein